jgi:hypothetical protein
MKIGMVKAMTVVVLGFSIFSAGCSDKKNDTDSSQGPVGAAPASPPQTSDPDKGSPPESGPQQNSSRPNQEQKQEAGSKS